MQHLRVLQFNADRGREASDLAEKYFLENCDIAPIQEPYCKFAEKGCYQRVKLHGIDQKVKAELWAQMELDITVLLQHTGANYVTVKLNTPDPVFVTSIYDEPGSNENRRLAELFEGWDKAKRKKHVLGGVHSAQFSLGT